jgi:hypothetical protein
LSPILVRPVREQLEHDRVIRLLQAKYKRKFDVAINPGNEQTMPVTSGPFPWFPDLVLQSGERTRKLEGVVEVETAESVNNLEAMSQWATFSRLRAPFHLYIPAASIDTAKRLCADLQIPVAEMWAYHSLGDQLRFTLVQKSSGTADGKRATTAGSKPATPRTRPAARRPAATVRPSGRPSTARPAGRASGSGARKTARKKSSTRPNAKKAARPTRPQKRK